MKPRDYAFLFFLSAVIYWGVAAFQATPGYMDAEYYYAGGVELVRGNGLVEMFIWNYLNEPVGIPHPAFAYWMPLTSWVVAAGMWITGQFNFTGAQSVFVFLAALIAPLTALLAYQWRRNRREALFAGLLAAFPAFYLPFLPTSDSFAIYALCGGLFMLVAVRSEHRMPLLWQAFALGLLAGLLHLSRADGIVWLALAGLWLTWQVAAHRPAAMDSKWLISAASLIIWLLCGYLLLLLPWMLRNLATFGSLLSPGGGATLWITQYNDLFIYPPEVLSFERWWAQGLPAILKARWWALGINLQRTLAEQGLILLLPIMLVAIWQQRHKRVIRFAILAWAVNLFVMTFVFPYQGARGGYFHSAAALLPFLYSLVPAGLEHLVSWGVRKRRWNGRHNWYFFAGLSLVVAVLLSLMTFSNQVLGYGPAASAWDTRAQLFSRVGQALQSFTAIDQPRVMVVNPPGYYLATGDSAIAIPAVDLDYARQIARRYNVAYLVLEPQHPETFETLYQHPQQSLAGFQYLFALEEIKVFQIQVNEP